MLPDTSWAWVGLAADVVSVAVPFATGGGAIVKVASKADDVIDLGRTVDKALDVADTAADIGKAADRIDDVNDSSRAVKNICEKACFIAGTLIETDNGSVPIEEITAGMLVYAHNPDIGETELKEVVQTFVRETNELVHIKVNGEEIITTPTHPFWVPQKGWTDAIQLRAGDRLQLLNGEYVIIEQVQHELLESPVTVYNFEVEDFHTYYVGDTSVLVHNKCTNEPFVPDEYWMRNAPLNGTPNSKIQHQKMLSDGSIETSTVIYDYAGRQSIRIDWTNHGRLDHGSPHVHFRFYGKNINKFRLD